MITTKKTIILYIIKPLFRAMCAVAVVLPLFACDEADFGPPRQASKAVQTETAQVPNSPAPSEPMLTVGDVKMPMPVPTGFKRLPHDHQLMRAMQTAMGDAETLLCMFEKTGPSSHEGSPNYRQNDTMRVSTLTKWVNVKISSLDFLKMIQPWQKESVVFNQNTLTFFEEAATTRLKSTPRFSYNLGLIDSSPLHLSFLKIVKYPGGTGADTYACITTSVLWRYGKVLNITGSRHIDNFNQIQSAVAESISYLNKILTMDRNPSEALKP